MDVVKTKKGRFAVFAGGDIVGEILLLQGDDGNAKWAASCQVHAESGGIDTDLGGYPKKHLAIEAIESKCLSRI